MFKSSTSGTFGLCTVRCSILESSQDKHLLRLLLKPLQTVLLLLLDSPSKSMKKCTPISFSAQGQAC